MKTDILRNLASTYAAIGQFEQAVEESRTALRLRPNSAVSHDILGDGLIHLDRFAEARSFCRSQGGLRDSDTQGIDVAGLRQGLFQIAFVNGDRATMERQIKWAAGKSVAYRVLDWQARESAYWGQAQRAAEFARRAIAALDRDEVAEVALEYTAEAALRAAALGQCGQAKTTASPGLPKEGNRLSLTRAALADAWCNEPGKVKPLIEELMRLYPQHTVVNAIWLPEIRAATAFMQGHAESAIDLLAPVAPYESVAEF